MWTSSRGIFSRACAKQTPQAERSPVGGTNRDRIFLRQIYLWNDFRFDGDRDLWRQPARAASRSTTTARS